MITLAKIIAAIILSLSLFSCNYDLNLNPGVSGNGDVTIENRTINQSFSSIKAFEGLHVYLTQGTTEAVQVETDANLQDLILVEVVDDVLNIHTKKQIRNSKSKKVRVTFKNINAIKATSGSHVISTNTIQAAQLFVETTSGSAMTLDVNTNDLECKSTSGSNLKLSGTSTLMKAKATSGSNLNASKLVAQNSQVDASSGANISVKTMKELTAEASSGASINYIGSPEKISKTESSAGSIKKQ